MSFRVSTFNILADAYIKPDRYPNSPPEALDPAARRRLLLATLDEMKADVYCLQEVEPAAFEAMAKHLGKAHFAGVFAQKPGKPEGSAIFARRSAFEIAKTHTLHYKDHDPRDAQLALVAVLEGQDRPLAVASTHLRWQKRSTPPNAHIGRRQLVELMDKCGALAPSNAAWLLCGDFNAISQSIVVEAAIAQGWKLSCRAQRPWDTTNINGKRRKLDYLLYKPEDLRPTPGPMPRLGRDTPMPSLTMPSDHLAATVDYVWSA